MERVQLIEKQWHLKISHQTLHKFYRAHGIRYRNGKAVYRSEAAKSVTIMRRRQVFSKLLATLISTHKPIIYCDETTFNSW